MEKQIQEVEREIIDTFASISQSLGYSEVHGKIIAALIVSDGPISLEELAKKTRYSIGMISLSLDLLEVIGMIKRIKKPQDRKLYVKFEGDLVESIKTAIMLKIKKGISDVDENFRRHEEEVEKIKTEEGKKLLKNLQRLEKVTKRMQEYISGLNKVKIPE